MTADKVVDASALAAVLLDETTADAVWTRLRDMRLAAPSLIYFEVTNACLKKARQFPEKTDIFYAAVERLRRISIQVVEADFSAVFKLAEQHGLSAYDASYLWLALELDAELVTLDAKLDRAYAAFLRS